MAKQTITRLRDLKVSARDQLMIDPRIIVTDDGHNPRNYNLPENHAHLDALTVSIRENGTLVPLLVRYDAARRAAILVDGECRLRANLELIAEGVEIETVPTIQVPGGNAIFHPDYFYPFLLYRFHHWGTLSNRVYQSTCSPFYRSGYGPRRWGLPSSLIWHRLFVPTQ